MIVIAVLGIIAAIAYPSYQDSVRKTRRADGKAALMSELQSQERSYSATGTYSAIATSDAINSEENHYKITGTACSGSTISVCIQLTATAQGDQANDKCGNLTLNSTLTKGRSGSEAIANCW